MTNSEIDQQNEELFRETGIRMRRFTGIEWETRHSGLGVAMEKWLTKAQEVYSPHLQLAPLQVFTGVFDQDQNRVALIVDDVDYGVVPWLSEAPARCGDIYFRKAGEVEAWELVGNLIDNTDCTFHRSIL